MLLVLVLHRRRFCELVAAFVERIAGVAFDPVEGDGVCAVELVELHPERLVQDGLAVGFAPAAALPAGDPFCDAVLEVLAVGVERDVRAFGREAERHDGGGEFHAVVCRHGVAAVLFCDGTCRFVFRDDRPAAGATGIFEAAAVGVDGVIDGR